MHHHEREWRDQMLAERQRRRIPAPIYPKKRSRARIYPRITLFAMSFLSLIGW